MNYLTEQDKRDVVRHRPITLDGNPASMTGYADHVKVMSRNSTIEWSYQAAQHIIKNKAGAFKS